MADILDMAMVPPSTTDDRTRTSLRKVLKKWTSKLLNARPTSSSSHTPTLPRQPEPRASSVPRVNPQNTRPHPRHAPSPALVFAPTTETIITSPFDPRNRPRVDSATSSPQSTLRKRPPKTRRNTAPADYFPSNPEKEEMQRATSPVSTITTTITATAPPKKRHHRYRLSLSQRSSLSNISSPLRSPTFPSSASSAPVSRRGSTVRRGPYQGDGVSDSEDILRRPVRPYSVVAEGREDAG
ncbi:hypothetical protein K491DRAFT_713848 [Lophiostoma macrostomum CBS 122681]|uniref:Uncharacterized protein n=1 Tax=Lophiostoma macrostomum CBS 122681 TaxID=1314788 RepID=A0A6A6TF49_9PLEO|nr:hypothetical protein K491DRAFT_713848 [Lophiostoma macrostomum CBS 122681]